MVWGSFGKGKQFVALDKTLTADRILKYSIRTLSLSHQEK